MKTIKTEKGWEEILTTIFKIERINDKAYMSVGKWVESNKRLGFYQKRKKCNCCKKAWESINPDENLYTVFTDKGHKTICQNCYSGFKGIAQITDDYKKLQMENCKHYKDCPVEANFGCDPETCMHYAKKNKQSKEE